MADELLSSLNDAIESRKAAFTVMQTELIAAIQHGIKGDNLALYSAIQDLNNADVHLESVSETIRNAIINEMKSELRGFFANKEGMLVALGAEEADLNDNAVDPIVAEPALAGQDVADAPDEHNADLARAELEEAPEHDVAAPDQETVEQNLIDLSKAEPEYQTAARNTAALEETVENN